MSVKKHTADAGETMARARLGVLSLGGRLKGKVVTLSGATHAHKAELEVDTVLPAQTSPPP